MISTAEAVMLLEEIEVSLPVVSLPLDEAVGRVLAEDIQADRPFPPFDRVMMDGIAIRMADLGDRDTALEIAGRAMAGDPVVTMSASRAAVQVATGAPLPVGADVVIPVEDLVRVGESVRIGPGAILEAGRFIHRVGSDHAAGDIVLNAGVRLSSRTIAIAAAAGRAVVRVRRAPRVAILSTGAELVPLGKPLAPHQIRPSNLHALAAGLRAFGAEIVLRRLVADDRSRVAEALAEARAAADITLVSGGLSRGDKDFVPGCLRDAGAEILVHGVRQRPGKPFLAARWAEGGLVFGLPGNPVSTLTCFHRYVIPALERLEGLPAPQPRYAVLAEPYVAPVPLTLFLPVRLEPRRDGVFAAFAIPASNSGDLAGLLESDGFLELPGEEMRDFPPGYTGRVFAWK